MQHQLFYEIEGNYIYWHEGKVKMGNWVGWYLFKKLNYDN